METHLVAIGEPALSGPERSMTRPAWRQAPGELALGPSPYGHRSLADELQGVAEERAVRGTKTPRPGIGTRAVTDPRAVSNPRAFISPRTLISPRAFTDPRGTTVIRAVVDR